MDSGLLALAIVDLEILRHAIAGAGEIAFDVARLNLPAGNDVQRNDAAGPHLIGPDLAGVIARGHDDYGSAANTAQDFGLLELGLQREPLFLGLDLDDVVLLSLPVASFPNAVVRRDGDDLFEHAARHVGRERHLVRENAGRRSAHRPALERTETRCRFDRAPQAICEPRHVGKGRREGASGLPSSVRLSGIDWTDQTIHIVNPPAGVRT